MNDAVRAVSRNPFTTGLFGGLAVGIPLMVLGFGGLGTAVLMVGIFGGLLAETLLSADDEDERGGRDDESETQDEEIAALREQYVEGKLSEAEFERRVEAHLADSDAGEAADPTEPSKATETTTRT